MGRPFVWGTISPLYKFAPGFDVFCDLNPGYYTVKKNNDLNPLEPIQYTTYEFINGWNRENGFDLDIAPGIGFTVRDVLFSVAVPIYNIRATPTATFGAWVFFSISK